MESRCRLGGNEQSQLNESVKQKRGVRNERILGKKDDGWIGALLAVIVRHG